jgi:hypothetical protein
MSVQSNLKAIQNKFAQLKKLQRRIDQAKSLYAQHDALMEEILPLFIDTEADKFVIRRQVTIGARTYRLNPHFYNEKKARVVSKVWKSTAFNSATIE